MDHQELLESDQQSLESRLMCPAKPQQESVAKKPRPQPEQALECPRCESTNTKFCYYNNYSLSQPRYFCKSCRRYWTKGGTLRNIPVGGGCRKSKRASSSSKQISIATTQRQDHQHSHHQHSDSNIPLTALDNLAYEASNQGESFHLPLMFAHQLHHIFSDEQIDGYSFLTGEGFLEAPSMENLQGLCFRLGDGAMGEAVHTNSGIRGESMLPYEEMKLDHFSSGENGLLPGCPWPLMNVDGISNLGNLGSIGGSWNDTGFSSSLHSLVNSPLM